MIRKIRNKKEEKGGRKKEMGENKKRRKIRRQRKEKEEVKCKFPRVPCHWSVPRGLAFI